MTDEVQARFRAMLAVVEKRPRAERLLLRLRLFQRDQRILFAVQDQDRLSDLHDLLVIGIAVVQQQAHGQ